MTEDTTFARWREHARDEHEHHRPVLERTIIHEDGIVTEVQTRVSSEGPLDLEDYVRTADKRLRTDLVGEISQMVCPPMDDCDRSCSDCIRYAFAQKIIARIREDMDKGL